MQEDTYQTIASQSKGLFKDKGSKFIALAHPVDNETKAKDILDDIKKQYYDARHHCYAWVFQADQSDFRFNDDGEPSGTAGRPIHGQIVSRGLTNIIVVVVRYFGGTKLGVRGLINAYRGATRDALDQASIVTRTIKNQYEIRFAYEQMNEVMRLVKEFELMQQSHRFDLSCQLVFSVRQKLANAVEGAFGGISGLTIVRLK